MGLVGHLSTSLSFQYKIVMILFWGYSLIPRPDHGTKIEAFVVLTRVNRLINPNRGTPTTKQG